MYIVPRVYNCATFGYSLPPQCLITLTTHLHETDSPLSFLLFPLVFASTINVLICSLQTLLLTYGESFHVLLFFLLGRNILLFTFMPFKLCTRSFI